MALFLPGLKTIELHMREPGGNLECKAKVSIARDKKQTGLLDVKNYLTKFDTIEQLQAKLLSQRFLKVIFAGYRWFYLVWFKHGSNT